MLPDCFQAFVQKTPMAVLARAALESLFRPADLDELFRRTARDQYESAAPTRGRFTSKRSS